MPIRHVLLAVLVTMIWGLNFTVLKVVSHDISPFIFTALRCAFVATFAFFIPKPNIPWKTLIAIGVLIGMMKLGFLFAGVKTGLPAGLASLTLQTQSLFSVIFALFVFKEYPKLNNVVGMLISFIGIGIVGYQMAGSHSNLLGFALVLAAAMSWGASNLIVRKTKGEKAVNIVVWWSLIPPIPMILLAYFFEGPETVAQIYHMNMTNFLLIIGSATFSMFVGYSIWGYLMQKHPVSMVAPFSLLVPITAITASYFILGETINLPTLVGGSLVILGLMINQLNLGQRIKKMLSKTSAEGI